MTRAYLLDLLRILAILLVLLAHFGQLFDTAVGEFFGVKNFYYVSLGGVGVSLFLILSGLLAGMGDGPKNTGYVVYLLKKILRIYPLYWLSVPLAIIGYLLGERLLEGHWPELFPNGFTTDLTGSVTGFYAWMGLWGGPYNSPSWFIALIMCMYAVFPALYFFIKRWPHVTLAILLGLSVVSRWYVGQQGLPFADHSLYEGIKGWFYRQYGFMPGRPGDWFPPCRAFEFGLGVYLAVVVPKSFWFRVKLGYGRPLVILSDLAFPLFLIHYPYLFTIPYMVRMGLSGAAAVSLYMIVLLVASYAIGRIDSRIPRNRILGKP